MCASCGYKSTEISITEQMGLFLTKQGWQGSKLSKVGGSI
jgi:hypothetical protein